MAVNTVQLNSNGKDIVLALQEAREKLDGAGGQAVLDFSSVRRIDSHELRAMEELACMAEEKAVTVELRGVNVDVYRVMKLLKLTRRFTFGS